MALDMKVFEDLLGSGMNDEYRTLLSNISGGMTPDNTSSVASIYGFDPNRHHGVKSMSELADEREAKWKQDQINYMMKSEQEGAAKRAKANENLRWEAQMQSAQNQLNNASQIRGRANHAQLGLDKFYSALQQEKMRQGRDSMSWGETMAAAATQGLMGAMGPLGSLAMKFGGNRGPTTNQKNIQGTLNSMSDQYDVMGRKRQPTAAAGQTRQQPNAQQRQALMQQMLRGQFGK